MKTITAIAVFFLYASVSYANEVKNDAPDQDENMTDQEISQVLKSIEKTNKQVSELEEQFKELEAKLNHAAEQYASGVLKLMGKKANQSKPQGSRLGIMLHKTENGDVFVSKVIPDSGAEKAGIKYADRILRVNSVNIAESKTPIRSIAEIMDQIKPGEEVQVWVSRDGKKRKFSVTTSVATTNEFLKFKVDVDELDFDYENLGQLLSSVLGSITNWDPQNADEADTEVIIQSFITDMPNIHSHFNALKGCGFMDIGATSSFPSLLDLNSDLGKYFGVDTGVLVLDAGTTQKDLKSGDILLSIAGEGVKNEASANTRLCSISEPTPIRVLRDKTELDIILQSVPSSPKWNFMRQEL